MPGELGRLPMYGLGADVVELEVFFPDINDCSHLDLLRGSENDAIAGFWYTKRSFVVSRGLKQLVRSDEAFCHGRCLAFSTIHGLGAKSAPMWRPMQIRWMAAIHLSEIAKMPSIISISWSVRI